MRAFYIFEAKSVQEYIMAGGRLRDIAGGSALVDALANNQLQQVLKHFENASILRQAGGGITLEFLSYPDAQRFRALWILVLDNYAPELDYSDGLSAEGTPRVLALESAEDAVFQSKSRRQAVLPQSTPLSQPSQRRAAPAIHHKERTRDGRCKITGEFADRASLKRREHLDQDKDRLGDLLAGQERFKWPNEFEEDNLKATKDAVVFPFVGDSKEIAIVHADGDKLGSRFIKLRNKLARNTDSGVVLSAVSRALSKAMLDAAKIATRDVLLTRAIDKIVPARPVLLGGDDITLILRADLALDFLDTLLSNFSKEITKAVNDQVENPVAREIFGDELTLSGAAVFIKARQPFSQALELCESLTSHAKKAGGGHVSFFRCTSSNIPSTTKDAWPEYGYKLTSCPYRVNGKGDAPRLADLRLLRDVLTNSEIGRSSLRNIVSDVAGGLPLESIEVKMKRINVVLEKRSPETAKAFRNALSALGSTDSILQLRKGDDRILATPLLDAFSWRAVGSPGEPKIESIANVD